MRFLITPFILMLFQLLANNITAQTNDFYDDAESHDLPLKSIRVEGEVTEPVDINFSGLPLRSVVVKETLLENEKDKFIGAYRYDGYSLYDILNSIAIDKKNAAEFPPIIDLYVEVENDKGEKIVISWGELYYPIHRHEILFTTRVARIVPSKTKELWPLPVEPKLVIASDLLTHRNISNPRVIRIRSFAGQFNIRKGMKPMYAEALDVMKEDGESIILDQLPSSGLLTYPAVFYGRGTGIHGTTPFTGVLLKQLLSTCFKMKCELLERGLFVLTGKDGYHAVFTYSEIMNRNDQAEVLLTITQENEDGGKFKVYPAADFFSDRAIKSLESIRYGIVR